MTSGIDDEWLKNIEAMFVHNFLKCVVQGWSNIYLYLRGSSHSG